MRVPFPTDDVAAEEVQALVRASAEGESGARETLARWCQPRVRRMVYLCYGPGPEVDDLTQTAMTQVFAGLDSFRGQASFWVWLDRVTMNVVRYHFRKRGSAVFQPFDDGTARHQPRGRPTGADVQVEQARQLRRLAIHLRELKPTLRLPLVLVLVHGYTVPEVALILDVRFETAKKRLFRARRQLVRRLKDDPAFAGWAEERYR